MRRMKRPVLALAALLPLLAACGSYQTRVMPAPGAPTLAPLPTAEVTHAKPPTAGAAIARIEATGNKAANAAECGNYLAAEAAKIGAPVVVIDAETAVPDVGPHCTGVAYAPGSATGTP
jgi:hypothetical protein